MGLRNFSKFFYTPTKFFPIPNMSILNIQSTEGFVYYLLNTQGFVIPNCYIEIKSFPIPTRAGHAVYHDYRGTVDEVKFTYNAQESVFEAWHADAPSTTFTMKPVTDEDDVITDLEIRFSHLPNFVAHFTWEGEEDYFHSPSSIIESLELELTPVCV